MKGKHTPAAVVLVNLGTPEELSVLSVREFLREFLADSRVVEIPRPIWWLILNLFVLPFRPKKVLENYSKVWGEGGSPLRVITKAQAEALQHRYQQKSADPVPTFRYAMTYGNPGIAETLEQLYAEGHRRIVVLPMYPQYSGSTTGAIYDQLADYVKGRRALPGLSIINSYFYEDSYIQALAQNIRDFWQENGQSEYLLFSYHGIPISYVEKGDPYAGQCECTTAAVLEALQMTDMQSSMSYQSLFGKAEWLKPYTSEQLVELARKGVKKVDVICPGFAADCIETLEEIAIENAELFKEAGGESLRLIPCLNDSKIHIDALEQILDRHLLAISPAKAE